MSKADLHIHSKESDGQLEVPELLSKISGKGLKTISITDHDTINGYLKACELIKEKKMDLEILSGVELTAIWEDREVHILAYDFDPKNSDFLALIAHQKLARRQRMKEIVSLLNRQGVDIEFDEIRAVSGNGNPGRPHAALVLIKKGVVSSVAEAFIRYLGSDKLEGIKTNYMTVKGIIDIIKNAGGVLSVAHPGPIYSSDELEALISYGIDGIECIHPSHNFNVQRNYTRLAKSKNLLITGGSDYHGSNRSEYDPYLGVVTISREHVESVKRTAEMRKKIKTQ